MQLVINGEARGFELEPGASVAALIAAMGLRPEVVAVEVNGTLVPRSTHDEHALAEGDRVECVTLVGGG